MPTHALKRFRKLRIDPSVPKCVVFVGVESQRGSFTPIGTGFLISYQIVPEETFLFILTASHLIDRLTDDAKTRLAIRLNRSSGEAQTVRVDVKRSFSHHDNANDVTLLAVPLDFTTFDVLSVEVNREQVVKSREAQDGVLPGDPVCAIGLYTTHYGSVSNAPVVRTGNVAAIASEDKILTQRGYASAHLIELRTIAGLSGSPVFQTTMPVRIRQGQLETRVEDNSYGIILGMLVGYHVLESAEDQILVPGEAREAGAGDNLSLDERNTGFGVVIPIERAIEVLESDQVQRAMKNALSIKQAVTGFKEA